MKLLVSACLLGENVRYDAITKPAIDELITLQKEGKVVACCPEVDGGLSTPRVPSEMQNDKVINQVGEDVTYAFDKGAHHALYLAKKYHIKVAILKSKSPSCSNNYIYDGTFSKTLIQGVGFTTKLLQLHGIAVFNENELDEALNLFHIV